MSKCARILILSVPGSRARLACMFTQLYLLWTSGSTGLTCCRCTFIHYIQESVWVKAVVAASLISPALLVYSHLFAFNLPFFHFFRLTYMYSIKSMIEAQEIQLPVIGLYESHYLVHGGSWALPLQYETFPGCKTQQGHTVKRSWPFTLPLCFAVVCPVESHLKLLITFTILVWEWCTLP